MVKKITKTKPKMSRWNFLVSTVSSLPSAPLRRAWPCLLVPFHSVRIEDSTEISLWLICQGAQTGAQPLQVHSVCQFPTIQGWRYTKSKLGSECVPEAGSTSPRHVLPVQLAGFVSCWLSCCCEAFCVLMHNQKKHFFLEWQCVINFNSDY